MRLISNSEVASWLQCRQKYYFEYVLDLEPKIMSDAINKGVLYHAALEGYYAGKSMGFSEQDCRDAAEEPLFAAAQAANADVIEIMKSRDLLTAYFDFYMKNDERYKVFAVETKLKLDMSDDFALVGTLDLVWQDLEDGYYIPVDHKSSYNFWSPDQAGISGQFIKYVAILRGMGLPVKNVMINQLRTRPLKNPTADQLFQRAWLFPTEARIKSVMAQHVRAGNEIMEFRALEDQEERIIPIYDKYICSNCPFLSLCDSKSNGAPIEYQIRADYQKRTGYGYNNSELGHE